ncbi:MAG: hypothetical protein JRN26_01925 [Nitrososphaerota archaeon]|jgi:hypothetical protein|nr:hypothetical protein [Nitrososphaerota archaeon]MDG6928193.1 hypothetical protein [Nitrososphaerota archaeon]MDG6930770.1 hypothetical protein [Nitrososphaerota archaeon]MDG6932011.1 hypothetical protein [Nitrososphaerota archaeon]MDG6935635.1 hypothetical protein [Nitrososphaerota archaeon]
MSEEESLITGLIKAVEGTKSTGELTFDNLTIKLQGTNTSVIINGKISFTAYPLQTNEKV